MRIAFWIALGMLMLVGFYLYFAGMPDWRWRKRARTHTVELQCTCVHTALCPAHPFTSRYEVAQQRGEAWAQGKEPE